MKNLIDTINEVKSTRPIISDDLQELNSTLKPGTIFNKHDMFGHPLKAGDVVFSTEYNAFMRIKEPYRGGFEMQELDEYQRQIWHNGRTLIKVQDVKTGAMNPTASY